MNWMICALLLKNTRGRETVPIMVHGSNVTCITMCRRFTLIWDSCSVARCRGAPCGRARHRTVWTTSVGHTMCLRSSSLQTLHVSTISFRPGLSGVRFGPMPLNHVIWEFRLMFFLFSEIHLSLVHHYRVFRRGLYHYAFCKDYLTRLLVFVSHVSAMAQCALSSPILASSGSPRIVRPCDADTTCPRPEAPDSSSGRSCLCTVTDDSGSGCPGAVVQVFCLSRLS